MMILVMSAFCLSAFSNDIPQQDTSRTRQDTVKKHTNKKYPGKNKTTKKKNWSKQDTLRKNDRKTDTVTRPLQ